MDNPDRMSIERSLLGLSDAEAIEIMEGRHPSGDSGAVHAVAAQFVEDLLEEPDAPAGTGSLIVGRFRRQPWMRMAAAMVAGVLLTSLLDQDAVIQPGIGVASGSVFYLDQYRSGGLDVPEIKLPADTVALVAYHSFPNADRLTVTIDRLIGDDGSSSDGQWKPILQNTVNSGVDGSVVVHLAVRQLNTGLYRLRIEGLAAGTTLGTMGISFRLVP